MRRRKKSLPGDKGAGRFEIYWASKACELLGREPDSLEGWIAMDIAKGFQDVRKNGGRHNKKCLRKVLEDAKTIKWCVDIDKAYLP